tara:strand:- start:474 stop:893 length:420 start_codon:yes stop_codon:yes gene_type:complete
MKLLFSFIGIIGLVLLSIFSLTQYDNYYPSIKDLNENPERYDQLLTEQYGRIKEFREDGFILLSGNEEILVKTKNIRNPIQGSLSILGTFHKEGFIELNNIHYFDYNNSKYVVSVIGLIIFLFIFFKEWKITSRGFKHA